MKVNYIMEINRFYDWLETNQLPKAAIALWHSLMHIANKTGWDNAFTVAISIIESKTGFKRSELFEARNVLVQKGRLRWRQRGGNLCAEYELIYFSVHNTDAKAYTSADANPDANTYTNPTQTGTINKTKLNETKLNSSSRDNARVKKKKQPSELEHWKPFVEVWADWYKEQHGNSYLFLQKDFAHLKLIYQFFKKRAAQKNMEFTEQNLVGAFRFFLDKAWNKDNWLRSNFSIQNVLSQFNAIVNEKRDHTGKKPPTGADVNTGSLLSKLAGMPD